jgi:hypothetical protein
VLIVPHRHGLLLVIFTPGAVIGSIARSKDQMNRSEYIEKLRDMASGRTGS